ncbi:SDR family NAD(P)-dependent oxidoreductase [Nibrella saemangeumensis]|uniref:SDR family NAD(P)-dependent oxidoreductase n=1 Tax=Nibrella saemangeumensis TaxID=1084526 RepID=A0ABP8MMV8_9BACT
MPVYHQNVVWVTGASSGIGEALALELARQGARLVLSARREDELQRVAGQTGLPASEVLVLPMDITDINSFPGKVQVVLQRFGRIDYVFQNAGITQRGTVAETEFDVYRRLMEINFFGVVALTKAVLPHMLRQQSGHFVVTSSVAGKIGVKQRSGYCASKHALHGFFDSLRAEIHDQGLRVTIVCPGYIKTPISLSALNEKGEAYNRMNTSQAQGMEADVFARRVAQAVAYGKEEYYIGGKEIAGIYLKRLFPAILSRLVRSRAAES